MKTKSAFAALLLVISLSFGAAPAARASMPAWNVTKETIEAVQGTWYDLDGNVAFVVNGDDFNGRRLVHAMNFAGPRACLADVFFEGEDLGGPAGHFIRWMTNRRFLTVDGKVCRNTKEPEYFESVRGVYLGMKAEDMIALLGEPEQNIKNWRFIWPDMSVNTEDGIVTVIFLPSGGAHLEVSGLGADDAPEDFAEAYDLAEGWDGKESKEIGSYGEYLRKQDGKIILSLSEK